MTLEGANLRIENSTINVTTQNRVVIYQSYSVCSVYDFYGMINNQIWINNIFTGINVGGYTAIIYAQNHCNFTLINNKFVDIRWIYSDISITIEHINLKCQKQPFTEYIIQNNTLMNTDQVRMSYIFFTLKFLEDGIQNVIIKDNKFINVSYYDPGLMVVQKLNMLNMAVKFENNYFENVYNQVSEYQVVSLLCPNVIINNNTIKNSHVPSFIILSTINSTLQNVNISNVQSLDDSSPSKAMILVQSSSNVSISDLSVNQVSFKNSRFLSLLSSQNVSVINVDVKKSFVSANHMIYQSQAKDVLIQNIKLQEIIQTTSNSLNVIQVELLQPYSPSSERELNIIYNNITVLDSSLQFFHLDSILAESNDFNQMKILFEKISITNNTLTGLSQLISTNALLYQNLSFSFIDCQLTNSTVENGAYFSFQHNSRQVAISQLLFEHNSGNFLMMIPSLSDDFSLPQNVTIQDCQINHNYAGSQALIYHSQNSKLTIKNTSFEDNYSIGRGSIIFAEQEESVSNILNSNFTSNYAYLGGVFFTQQGGKVQCTNCSISENFAVTGGVAYSQNEGMQWFINCSIQKNRAL